MSTTQHPLTDETRDLLVSYISGGTIDCSSEEGRYDSLTAADARTIVESLWEPMAQAAQARPAEITDEMVEAGASYAWEEGHPGFLGWNSLTEYHREGCRRDVRNVLSAALAVATPAEPLARTILAVPDGYGAPHHDADRIKAEDFVLQVDRDGHIRAGKVHYRDASDDWHTENDDIVTWAECRADRPDAVTVWPALTPPAVEVEIPGEDGAILLGVEALDPATDDVHRSNKTVYLDGRWFGIDSHTGEEIRIWPTWITAFTLPDGTRARRDGEHANGEPRFAKEEEK